MSSVDEHVVSMRFNNKDFERNAQKSLGTLDKLKQALNFKESSKSLKELNKDMNNLDVSQLNKTMQALENRFSTLGVVGASVLNRLTNSAIDFGKSIVKDVTKPMTNAINQIKSGGLNRAFNLEHARFQLMGLTNDAQKVSAILDGPVAQAVDGTAYGLDQAAVAASSLVASGLKTEELLGPLSAISGVASMTGRDFSDIADIFTTVASNGKLMTMQLRQLSASGLNASAALAKSMNKTEAEINEMVTQGKISFADFSNAMNEAFGENAKRANETFNGALSNVKAALSRIGAKVATPGLEYMRDVFNELRPVVNKFNEMLGSDGEPGTLMYTIKYLMFRFKTLATNLLKSKTAFNFITKLSNGLTMAFNKLDKLLYYDGPIFTGFKALGNILRAIKSWIEPVAQAFLDIFPPITINRINEIVHTFKDFTEKLTASDRIANNIRKTFRGVFMVFRAVAETIKMVATQVWSFVKGLAPAGAAVTDIFGTLGDVLANVAYYIRIVIATIGYVLDYFGIMENLGLVIGNVFSAVGNLLNSVLTLIGGALVTVGNAILGVFGVVLPPVENAGDVIGLVLAGIGAAIDVLLGLINWLATAISNVASVFTGGADSLNLFSDGMEHATGIAGVFKNILGILGGVIKAVIDGIGSFFTAMTGSSGFLDGIANVFLKIGEALKGVFDFIVGLFTGNGSVSLSDIFSKIGEGLAFVGRGIRELTADLTPGNIAAAAFIGIMIAMSIAITKLILSFTKVSEGLAHMTHSIGGFFDALKARVKPQPRTVEIIQSLTAALIAMTASIVILAMLPNRWEAIAALAAISALMAGLAVTLGILSKILGKSHSSIVMLKTLALNMAALGVSVLALAVALRIMNEVKTDGLLIKALALMGVIATFGIIAALMAKIAPRLSMGSIALIAFAFAVKMLADALVTLTDSEIWKLGTSVPALVAIIAGVALAAALMSSVKFSSGLGMILAVLAIKLALPLIKDVVDEVKEIKFEPILKFIDDYKFALLVIAGFAALAAVIIKKITDSFAKLGMTFIAIGASIWIITQSIEQISNIGIGSLLKASAVIAGLLAFFVIMTKVSKMGEKEHMDPLKMAKSFILMSVAVGALAALIVMTSLIDWKQSWPGAVAVAGILGIFTLMMLVAKHTKEAKPVQMATSFLLMAGAVAALSAVIYMIGQLEWDVILKGGIVVGAILVIFALMMKLADLTKKAKPIQMGTLFVLMAGAVAALAGCIYLIGNMKLKDVVTGSVVVGAAMLLLMRMTKQILNIKPAQTKAVLALCLSMIAQFATVIAAVIIVGQQPLANVAQGAIVVAAVILLLEHLMKKISSLKFPSNWKATLSSTVMMFGTIASITGSIMLIGTMSLGKAIQGAGVLLSALAIYSKIFKTINSTRIKTKAVKLFLLGAVSLLEIAGAIWLASSFSNWSSILSAMVGISVVLKVMADVFEQVNKARIKTKAIQLFLLATASVLEIAVAIAIGSAFADWLEIAASMVGITIIVDTMAKIFEKINAVNPDIKKVSLFLLATASTIEIAVAVLIASQGKDWASIAAGMVGIVAILLVMSVAFETIDKANPNIKNVALFLLATLSTIEIAAAIWLASAFSNAGSILTACIGLAAILAEMAIIFEVINAAPIYIDRILAFDAASAAVILIGIGLRQLADAADWKNIEASANAMSIALGVIAGVCIAFGLVGPEVILGAVALDAVALVLAIGILGILGICYLLEELGGASDGIRIGGKVIEAIGEVIGRAIGAFFKGIGMELIELIPEVGKRISEFATNAKPFFDIMSSIDGPTVFSNVAHVAGAMLILGAGEFVNALADFASSLLGGGMVEMMKDLLIFGAGISKFADLTSNITNGQNFKNITEAAKNIAGLMMYLSNQEIQNAFTQWIGFKDFGKTAEDLKSVAAGMGEIADELNGVNLVNVDKLNSCASAIKAIADAAPTQPGLIQKAFTGYKDIAKTTGNLVYFATSMAAVSESMDEGNDIKTDNMNKIGACADVLKKLVDALPPEVSILESFWGKEGAKQDLGTFATNVVAFAGGMALISKAIDNGAINEANIQMVGRVGKVFTDLANALPEAPIVDLADGLYTIGGKMSIKDLASDLGYLGTGITNFSNGIAGADVSKINSVTPFVDAMGKVALATACIADTEVVAFSNTFVNFANAMQTFNDELKDVDQKNIDKFATIIDKLLSTFNKKFTDSKKYQGITEVFKAFSKISDVIKTIKVDGASDIDAFKESVTKFKDEFGNFLTFMKAHINAGTFDLVSKKLKEFKEVFKNTSGKAGSKGDYSEFETFASTLTKVSKSISKLMTGDSNIEDFQASLTKLGDAYKNFVQGMNGISSGKGGDIEKAGEKIEEFGEAISKFNDSKIDLKALNTASKQLDETITHIKDSIDKLQTDIKGSYDGFKDIGEMILKKLDVGLDSDSLRAKIKTDGTEAGKAFADGADPSAKGSTLPNYLQITANHIVEGFKNGLRDNNNLSKMETAGVYLAQRFLKGFKSKKGVDENSPSKAMKQSGIYVVEGFLMGIDKNKKEVDKSGIGMASTFLNSFKDLLGIHSPATALIEAAKNTVAGWLSGLKSGASKIFGSGESFGGDFIGGLKNALSKIKKGDFNGDKLLNSFKKKLGIEKIFDTKKTTKSITKQLKSINTAATKQVNKGGKSGGGSTASKAGQNAAKQYVNSFAAYLTSSLISLQSILGTKMSKKDLAIELFGDKNGKKSKYQKEAKNILGAYEDAVKQISKSKDFMRNMESNQAAILKFAKAYQKSTKYIAKASREMTLHASAMFGTVTTKTLETVGGMLYKSSSDYKASEKTIKKSEAKIETIQKDSLKKRSKLKKYEDKMDDLRTAYKNAKSEKQKKNIEKQMKSLNNKISKINSTLDKNRQKVKDLRKTIAKETDKIGKGTMNMIKTIRAESRALYYSWLDFSNLDIESSNIMTGLEALEVKTIGVSESIDDLDEAMSESSKSATEAANAYDGLSASMDTGINLMERFSKTGSVEADALFENADSQLEAYAEFQAGIQELENRGLDSKIVDQLASEGPQALNKIRGFLSMTTKQLDEYNARVDKQKEYEAKALERSLRRQYEMWQEYLKKVDLLKTKFGSGYGSDEFYKAIVGQGVGGLNYLSTVLKMDESSFNLSKKYFIEGLTKTLDNDDVLNAATSSGEESGKSILKGLENAIKKIDKTTDLDMAYKNAIDKGLNKDLADYIYSKGEEDGLAYFKGLEDANNYGEVNSKWLEYTNKNTTKNVKSIFDNINKQVERQSKNVTIDENHTIQKTITNFLSEYMNKNTGKMSQADLQKAVQGYSVGFETLIKELRDAGYDSATILETVQQWVKDDGTNWNELTKTLNNLNTRTANNAVASGQSVKESWDKVVKNTRENARHLMSINQKMGDRMTKQMYDYLQDLSPEELAAFDSLSASELQEMAEQWYDADLAADAVADQITTSWIKGYEKGQKNFKTWFMNMNNGLYDSTKAKGTSEDRRFEIADYLSDMVSSGKSVDDVIKDINKMDDKTKEALFKFGKENGYKHLNWLLQLLKNHKGEDWSSVLKELQSGKYSVKDLSKTYGDVIQNSIVQGADIYEYVYGIGSENVIKGLIPIIKDVDNPDSKIGKTLTDFGTATRDSIIENGVKGASEGLGTMSENVVKGEADTYVDAGSTLGDKFISGAKTKLKDKEDALVSPVHKLAKKAKDENKAYYKEKGVTLGKQMIAGLKEGIEKNKGKVSGAANSTAVAVYKAVCKTLGIKSPSRVFMEVGNYIDQGLAKGILDNATIVDGSTNTLTDSLLNNFRSSIQMMQDAINGEFETDPVITPTLDLTQLSNQISGVGNLFDASVGVKANYTPDDPNNQNGDNSGVTFVQNNYSPKSLSRFEIYRDTRSLLSSMTRRVTT